MELVRQPTVMSFARPSSLPPLLRPGQGLDAKEMARDFQSSDLGHRAAGVPIRRLKMSSHGYRQLTQRGRKIGSRPPDLFRCLDAVPFVKMKQETSSCAASRASSRETTPRGGGKNEGYQERGDPKSGQGRKRHTASASTLSVVTAAYMGDKQKDAFSMNSSVLLNKAFHPDSAEEAEERAQARIEKELSEMRTGEDAVAFFTRHGGNTHIKLIYCIRPGKAGVNSDTETPSPYGLMVIPEDRLNRHCEHFTITPSGVLHVLPGQLSEYTPLPMWVHECAMYRVLTVMNLFRLHVHRKTFVEWQMNSRDSSYCRRRQKLARQLFLARPNLVGPMLQAKTLTSELAITPLTQLPDQCCRVDDFRHAVQASLSDSMSGAQRRLENKRDALVTVMEELVSSVSKAGDFMLHLSSKRPSSFANSKTKSFAQERHETRERAKLELLLREDEVSVQFCIRLADCMLQASLTASVAHVADEFRERVVGGPGEHKRKLFSATANFGARQKEVLLEPRPSVFMEAFDNVLEEVICVADAIPLVASARPLLQYAPVKHCNQTVRQVISADRSWAASMDSTRQLLRAQLAEAQQVALEMCEPYWRVYQYWQSWDEARFLAAPHSLEALSDCVKLMSEYKDDMSKIRTQRTAGVIVVESRGIRDRLVPVPGAVLNVVCPLLASTTRQSCTNTCRRLDQIIKDLDESPVEAAAFETYKHTLDAAEKEEPLLKVAVQDANSAHCLLKKQGTRIPLDDQVLLDGLAAKLHALSTESLPAAKGFVSKRLREQWQQPTVDVVMDLDIEYAT
eukprot:TRINITY_DN31327_c0_g1_i1.p1 TRINITY_DN31327_c0_g1~~TRINITY_DN31327_c0_g1_i1.p1  ORF type:complete len:794 (-),score=117.08 TRINITY_DN31327_c0_g1_i1:132-2513(-)